MSTQSQIELTALEELYQKAIEDKYSSLDVEALTAKIAALKEKVSNDQGGKQLLQG